MTTDELRERRERLGFTPQSLATALGVHFTTTYRWERGEVPCPPWLDLALEALERRRSYVPMAADVLRVMREDGVGQDEAVRRLGGTP